MVCRIELDSGEHFYPDEVLRRLAKQHKELGLCKHGLPLKLMGRPVTCGRCERERKAAEEA